MKSHENNNEQLLIEKFETLNHVRPIDGEFQLLLDKIITPDVLTASRTLRAINAFTREAQA